MKNIREEEEGGGAVGDIRVYIWPILLNVMIVAQVAYSPYQPSRIHINTLGRNRAASFILCLSSGSGVQREVRNKGLYYRLRAFTRDDVSSMNWYTKGKTKKCSEIMLCT